MKPRPFAYLAPGNVDEATEALAEHGDDALILAGGQSLMPLLNLRLASPSVLIDISRLEALQSSHPLDGGGRRLGSGVTHSAIEDNRVGDPTAGLLPRVARGIAYRTIRNRGTLGGSIAHADPQAEWPLIMCALGANVQLRSSRGERTIAATEFLRGFLSTDRAPDELCVAIDVPALTESHAYGFCKLARKSGDFADAMALAIARRSPSGDVDDITLWLGATRDRPARLPSAEQAALAGATTGVQQALLTEAVRVDLDNIDELSDPHRAHMHCIAVWRALEEALEMPIT